MLSILLPAAMAVGLAWAGPDVHDPENWAGLRDRCAGMETWAEQVEHTLNICQARGLSATDAERLMTPVRAANEESLPVCCIIEKIDEGLSKKAPVTNILMASEARLNFMRKARKIVAAAVGGSLDGHGKGSLRLIENAGMALESGLDPSVVEAVVIHNGNRQLGRLAHVMEAAETLHLAGFEDQHVQRVLIDFVDRNLNRYEMYRALEVLKEGIAGGRDFESVYSSLWISAR